MAKKQAPNLWRDTVGATFTDKYAVLLLDVETHQHGKRGRHWVTYNDALNLAHQLNQDKNKARVERR
jgi:hypothetical protein